MDVAQAAALFDPKGMIAILDGYMAVLLHGQRAAFFLYDDLLLAIDQGERLIALHDLRLFAQDRAPLVVADGGLVIMADHLDQVLLGMKKELFMPFAIVKLDLVESTAARRAGAANGADVLGSGQLVWN